MTPVEHRLWFRLRGRRLGGFKFRRQQGIGSYVVDFYCAERKMVIEIDGSSHGLGDQMKKDEIRQSRIEELGFRVIRYRNDQVVHQLEAVLEDILKHLEQSPHPSPLPRGERE